jgi:hypothetical protein
VRIRLLSPLALLLVASTASAQIRVPRPRVPNPLDRARQSATDAVTPARQPTFDERVIEMTDARLTALVRGLRAEQQQRPALEAGYKKNADDRAAFQASTRRSNDRITTAQNCLTNSREYRAIYGDSAAQRKTAERLQKARDRGDERLVQTIEDSVTNAMMNIDPQVAMGLVTAQQRCGASEAVAAMPTTPRIPPAEPRIRLGDSLRIIGTGASGMTDEQYGVMRERVLAFLTTDEDDLRASMYVFSSKEMTALKAKRAELQRYQTLLVEG